MQLSTHCYALTGFAYIPPWSVNAGIVVGQETTLVVDSGPTQQAAATIYGYARALRASNKLLVINTEQHLDHIDGNSYFADRGIDIYGHRGIRRNDADLQSDIDAYIASVPDPVRRERPEGRIPFTDTHITNPNKRIDQDMSLDLGGVTVEVVLTPGHTPTNLCVVVPADRVVFCGDCVVSGYLPNLEGGDAAAWATWLKSLDRLASFEPEVLVCGHGPVVQGAAVPLEIARVRAAIQEAIATGKPPTG